MGGSSALQKRTPAYRPDDSRYLSTAANGNVQRGMRGLRAFYRQAPATTTPTYTLSGTLDAATQASFGAWNGGTNTPNTLYYTFSGSRTYVQASRVFPGSSGVTRALLPQSPPDAGDSTADFWCDSPAVSFETFRSYGSTMRVIVDDVEVLRTGVADNAGTAQAGAAGSITLATSASTQNGFYLGEFVRISGGTGAGQVAQITGYTGSSRVATVAPNWATAPDSTSTYEVTRSRQQSTTSSNAASTLFHKLDWNGERRMRRYRVETVNGPFLGVWTASATDTVRPAINPAGTPTIWAGDSYSAGTGTDSPYFSCLARIACDNLGWDLRNCSIGGTGYLNPNSAAGAMTLRDRLLPPVNSWQAYGPSGMTAGSYKIVQGGVSATIAYNATIAQMQSALDTAFGTGAWTVHGVSASVWWILRRDGQASSTAPLTLDTTNLTTTGLGLVLNRYVGEIASQAPTDQAGNYLPFNIVLAGGHNDTSASNAAYTTAALQAEVSAVITGINAAYPTATVIVVGIMYLPGGQSGSTIVTNANAAILAAATASAKKINGQVPFIETLATQWFTGNGCQGAPTGSGNSDLACWSDAVHPTNIGHSIYGVLLAQAITALLSPA